MQFQAGVIWDATRSAGLKVLSLHPTPYTLHSSLYTLHPTPYTLHSSLYTLHFTLYTLHSTIYSLHPTPYTLHPTLDTRHFKPYTLHPASVVVSERTLTIPLETGVHLKPDLIFSVSYLKPDSSWTVSNAQIQD